MANNLKNKLNGTLLIWIYNTSDGPAYDLVYGSMLRSPVVWEVLHLVEDQLKDEKKSWWRF